MSAAVQTYGAIGLVVLVLLVLIKCMGSEETIRAVVTDAETGLPMAGVEVEFRFPTVLGPGEGWGRGAPAFTHALFSSYLWIYANNSQSDFMSSCHPSGAGAASRDTPCVFSCAGMCHEA